MTIVSDTLSLPWAARAAEGAVTLRSVIVPKVRDR